MLEYTLPVLIGCLLGTLTGLIPGLHVNTLCLLSLSLYPSLGLSTLDFGAVMVAMALTHTFIDYLPAIYLGVPEEATSLSVLPAHRLVLEGNALKAVKLTAIGSLLGLLFSLLLLPPTLILLPRIYPLMKTYLIYVVLAATTYLIIRENTPAKRLWAATIFLLAGWLGHIAFKQHLIAQSHILFPVFTGLFGLSTLIAALQTQTALPPQQPYAHVPVTRELLTASFLGTLGGLAIGVLPAMSPSQAGIILIGFTGATTARFLTCLAAINTADAVYSLASAYTIGNPRSGVATMLADLIDIDAPTLLFFTGCLALAAPPAYLIHLRLGTLFSKGIARIDYPRLCLATLAGVTLLVWLFTGWFGLAYAAVACLIGLLPIRANVSRTHTMGVLILPTALILL